MSEVEIGVRVDHDLCIGNGMCWGMAPQVFSADAAGQSVAGSAVPADLELVLDAAASCPVAAISVFDRRTGEEIPVPY